MAASSLRTLPGVGPRAESVLGEVGVDSLSDLASASATALADQIQVVTEEKLALWIEEARRRERMGPVGGAGRSRLRELPGVGVVTELRLRSNGIRSLGDVLTVTPDRLAEAAGKSRKMAEAMVEEALRLRREAEQRERLPQPRLAEERWPGTRPPSPRHDPDEQLWPDDEHAWVASRETEANCGLQVRSKPEAWVADFLYEEGIYFVHEPVICGYRPDFYIPGWGVILEYWGWDSAEYRERRETKTKAYRSTGYRLVGLESSDGRDERVLREVLRNRLLEVCPGQTQE